VEQYTKAVGKGSGTKTGEISEKKCYLVMLLLIELNASCDLKSKTCKTISWYVLKINSCNVKNSSQSFRTECFKK